MRDTIDLLGYIQSSRSVGNSNLRNGIVSGGRSVRAIEVLTADGLESSAATIVEMRNAG